MTLTSARLIDRIMARVLDALIVTAVAVVMGQFTGFGIGWLVATVVGVYAYFVAFDLTDRSTPGKRFMRIQVVDTAGVSLSRRAAMVRESFVVVGAVPFVGPVLAAVAWAAIVVTVRSDPDGRGYHDHWSGTRVVADPTRTPESPRTPPP